MPITASGSQRRLSTTRPSGRAAARVRCSCTGRYQVLTDSALEPPDRLEPESWAWIVIRCRDGAVHERANCPNVWLCTDAGRARTAQPQRHGTLRSRRVRPPSAQSFSCRTVGSHRAIAWSTKRRDGTAPCLFVTRSRIRAAAKAQEARRSGPTRVTGLRRCVECVGAEDASALDGLAISSTDAPDRDGIAEGRILRRGRLSRRTRRATNASRWPRSTGRVFERTRQLGAWPRHPDGEISISAPAGASLFLCLRFRSHGRSRRHECIRDSRPRRPRRSLRGRREAPTPLAAGSASLGLTRMHI